MNSLSHEESLDEMAIPEDEPVCMCSVCGVADDRPLLRFIPDPSRPNATQSGCLDIALHLFCGKTAAILQEQPSLEILTKAGLKNKHGIGPEINAALSRTRSAILDCKEFYLVREFEANLYAIRTDEQSSIFPNETVLATVTSSSLSRQAQFEASPTRARTTSPPHSGNSPNSVDPLFQSLLQYTSNSNLSAASEEMAPWEGDSDGKRQKIECPCGGTHWSTCTSAGVQSFRAHVATPIHQNWLNELTANSNANFCSGDDVTTLNTEAI